MQQQSEPREAFDGAPEWAAFEFKSASGMIGHADEKLTKIRILQSGVETEFSPGLWMLLSVRKLHPLQSGAEIKAKVISFSVKEETRQ